MKEYIPCALLALALGLALTVTKYALAFLRKEVPSANLEKPLSSLYQVFRERKGPQRSKSMLYLSIYGVAFFLFAVSALLIFLEFIAV
ncbi:MAG: hypothetical protein JW739_04330 [Opitutales bacterium]|nr:hypothetical protein [Opitutales bacterium]